MKSDPARIWQPLPRAEGIKAVLRQNPSPIPIVLGKWWGEGLVEQYGSQHRARYAQS